MKAPLEEGCCGWVGQNDISRAESSGAGGDSSGEGGGWDCESAASPSPSASARCAWGQRALLDTWAKPLSGQANVRPTPQTLASTPSVSVPEPCRDPSVSATPLRETAMYQLEGAPPEQVPSVKTGQPLVSDFVMEEAEPSPAARRLLDPAPQRLPAGELVLSPSSPPTLSPETASSSSAGAPPADQPLECWFEPIEEYSSHADSHTAIVIAGLQGDVASSPMASSPVHPTLVETSEREVRDGVDVDMKMKHGDAARRSASAGGVESPEGTIDILGTQDRQGRSRQPKTCRVMPVATWEQRNAESRDRRDRWQGDKGAERFKHMAGMCPPSFVQVPPGWLQNAASSVTQDTRVCYTWASAHLHTHATRLCVCYSFLRVSGASLQVADDQKEDKEERMLRLVQDLIRDPS